jgi:MFS family permease
MMKISDPSPFKINNVKRFIAFRIFFNSRFYYPVFTILFLDFGLTLSQFALLNAVWAATIVMLEVPSGALADIIGRRKLLITAGILMVFEMAILCFAPRGNTDVLFVVFVVNRILSGAAEAAASGADEAITYDALKNEGRVDDWDLVLERQMRLESLARMAAMALGAAVYDPRLVQKAVDLMGWSVTVNQSLTMRFPLFLTLFMALGALYAVVKFKEPNAGPTKDTGSDCGHLASVWSAFQLTFQAGLWILKTPFALVVILSGLLFDHVIRMLLTMNSQYFRLIDLPEALFGLIGSARSLFGLFIPALALIMVRRFKPRFNLGIMVLLTFTGLYGMSLFWPIWGLLPAMLLSVVMYFTTFFISRYLNQITESHQRATVLSFKGLSYNMAYGLIGILYSVLLAHLRGRITIDHPEVGAVTDQVFIASIQWFPWYFLAASAVLFIAGYVILRRNNKGRS